MVVDFEEVVVQVEVGMFQYFLLGQGYLQFVGGVEVLFVELFLVLFVQVLMQGLVVDFVVDCGWQVVQ